MRQVTSLKKENFLKLKEALKKGLIPSLRFEGNPIQINEKVLITIEINVEDSYIFDELILEKDGNQLKKDTPSFFKKFFNFLTFK